MIKNREKTNHDDILTTISPHFYGAVLLRKESYNVRTYI